MNTVAKRSLVSMRNPFRSRSRLLGRPLSRLVEFPLAVGHYIAGRLNMCLTDCAREDAGAQAVRRTFGNAS